MADDQEKTEEPTPQKIEDARKKGNVPKSQEVGGLFTLFVAILMFMILIPFIYDHIIAFFEYIFSINHEMINQAGMIPIIFAVSLVRISSLEYSADVSWPTKNTATLPARSFPLSSKAISVCPMNSPMAFLRLQVN